MRTTVDLDPRVLAAARGRVRSGRNRTLGEALSQLALNGLEHEKHRQLPESDSSGLSFFPSVPGHVITGDMVTEALDDE
ncbi:MAG: hypothetical protein ACTH1D_04690 [Mycobacteriaceae bacterium]|uniref:hypothetical protein n=1 Tax=Corynebacterium sp. TaxID=1720 RepID=UPI003F97862F